MANGKSALDVCTPSLTPVTNAKLDNGKRDKGSSNEGVENVEYTLKPTTRAYASTARYIHTHRDSFEETFLCVLTERGTPVLSDHEQAESATLFMEGPNRLSTTPQHTSVGH